MTPMLGNGILGIPRESNSKVWERRAPLTPSHCARLLHAGRGSGHGGVKRILIQPSTKRILQDIQYENVGCEISDDLSECGLILGVKQPEVCQIFCMSIHITLCQWFAYELHAGLR